MHDDVLALACPSCLETDYRRNLEETEIKLAPELVRGDRELKLLRAANGEYHFGYHDGFSQQPYCGKTLRTAKPSFCRFPNRPNNLCHQCLAVLMSFNHRTAP